MCLQRPVRRCKGTCAGGSDRGWAGLPRNCRGSPAHHPGAKGPVSGCAAGHGYLGFFRRDPAAAQERRLGELADQINSAWQKECSLFFSVEEVEQDEFDARIAAGKYTIALAPIRAEGGSVYQMLQQFTTAGGSLTGYADTVYADRLALSAQQTGKDRCALLAQCERQLLESCTVCPCWRSRSVCCWQTACGTWYSTHSSRCWT